MTPAAMFRLWVSAVGLVFLVAFGLFHINPSPEFIVAVAAAITAVGLVVTIWTVRRHTKNTNSGGDA